MVIIAANFRTITFLVMSIIALALDLCLLSFHGLHLITRCNPNEFEGVVIRNCRKFRPNQFRNFEKNLSEILLPGNEFDHVLLIMRHGTSLLLVIIGTTLHAVINFCSIIISFYVVCRFEQVWDKVKRSKFFKK